MDSTRAREQARTVHAASRAAAAAFTEAGWTWGDGAPTVAAIEDRIYDSLDRIAAGDLAAGWTNSSGRIAVTVDEDGDVRIMLDLGDIEGVADRAALERAARDLAKNQEPVDKASPPPLSDEPLGTCTIHGDYWTDDCMRCGR